MTLSWKKTGGNNCYYRLGYEDSMATDTLLPDKIAQATQTFTVKDLQVGETYKFYIYTVCTLADGSELESTDTATITGVTIVPGKVTGVKTSSEAPADAAPTDLYVKVWWTAVDGVRKAVPPLP